jgi:hypothetical protein
MGAEEVDSVVRRIFTHEDVYVDTCELDDRTLLGLARSLRHENTRMVRLKLSCYGGMSRRVAQAFRDSLKVNTSLRRIIFCWVRSSDILSTLLTGVTGNQSLEQIYLDSCPLCAQDVRNLVATFRHGTDRLEALSIDYSRLGDEAATVLGNALADGSLRHLKHLRLSGGLITSAGAAEIARGLETNTTLEDLDLSYSEIGDEGAVALARSLSDRNTMLKTLYLTYCDLSNVGAFALACMLERNNTIDYMAISMNDGITLPGKQALVAALSSNISLATLVTNQREPLPGQADHQLGINRFRKKYLSRDHTRITPAIWPHVFARVADKPSVMFLFLQENHDMLIPHLPDSSTSRWIRKRKTPDYLRY